MKQRKILLLEPNYKNKYPPMGLMKLATYYRLRGDDVRFFKGDMRFFVARLLFEDYCATIDYANIDAESAINRAIHKFMLKQGPLVIIEFIKTGKYAPLKKIAEYSTLLADVPHCSFKDLLSVFSPYRNKYMNNEYPKFDRVCVTTLFTFYWKETIDTILFAKKLCKSKKGVHVGGIASSLVPDYIFQETGIRPHVGLLNKPKMCDSDKKGNIIIDDLPLDYSILDEIEYRYPTEDAYFGYMTRGCVNRCPFCSVHKIEPIYCDYQEIKTKIQKVNECFGAKKDLLLMDNNVFASNCFDEIIGEIKSCGFEKGAIYTPSNEYDIAFRNLCCGFNLGGDMVGNVFNDRAYFNKIVKIYDKITARLDGEKKGTFYNGREELGLLYVETATKEKVIIFHDYAKKMFDKLFKQIGRIRFIDFNQGLDGGLATQKKMSRISEIAIRPLRIAFDHWSKRAIYEKAVRIAKKNGMRDLSNYLLYNFRDHPDELYLRMKLNIDLCDELRIAIYSFPMKYHPIDDPDFFRNRDYIGQPHWNRKFIRAIQAVLNSTHGKIGRGKPFFEAAFGRDIEEYRKILWMPEALIIQRYKYDIDKRNAYYRGKPTPYDDVDEETGMTTSSWWSKFSALDAEQRVIAERIIAQNRFTDDDTSTEDEEIKKVLSYYRIKRSER